MTPHSARLERWLGRDNVEIVSESMRDWYGPPIAVSGVPGNVFAVKGGDFIGECKAGWETNAFDRLWDLKKRIDRGFRFALDPKLHGVYASAGFASLTDLITKGTINGRRQELTFQKASITSTGSVSASHFKNGNLPVAGSAASAAPGGTVPTNATTGSLPFVNPISGENAYAVGGWTYNAVGANSLLLYDRIFAVAKTMSSTGTEAVTGVPTRYTNTVAGSVDSAEGNFLFVEIGSGLSATAHNWTVCQYTNQANTTLVSLPSLTGISGGSANGFDHPVNQWFAPLATGDSGVLALTQMQCSASVTGAIDFVIGHPIAWIPCVAANLITAADGINTGFSLTRVFSNACLSLIEVCKPSSSGGAWAGSFTIVSG